MSQTASFRTVRAPMESSGSGARNSRQATRAGSSPPKLATLALALLAGCLGAGCTTHHWAQVQTSHLPPTQMERVVHTSRLVVAVSHKTDETQCVVYKKYSPVCFYNIRPAVEEGLVRGLWPSFPEVVLGSPEDAAPGDYVLQVELELDALPPDGTGPGWSAGVRGRYRLLRDQQVKSEATLASRSRADLPYGAPLGLGATDVVDAALVHITTHISAVPETQPGEPVPLPAVAAKIIKPNSDAPRAAARSQTEKKPVAASAKVPDPSASKQAKSLPEQKTDEQLAPPPPASLESDSIALELK